jgi:hypothetical protein
VGNEGIAVTAPTLIDYQMQIGSLVMGASTSYRITRVTGLGQPDRRSGDVSRPLSDGDFKGSSFYSSRTVVIDVNIEAATGSGATALLSALSLQWRGTNILYAQMPGWGTRAIEGEPRRMRSDDKSTNRFGLIPVVLEYYSPTPAMYEDIVTTGTPPAPAAAFTFPATFPVTFGAVTGGLSTSTTNSGDYDYPPVMRVYGPYTDVTITRNSDSAFLGLAGVSVVAGEYIEIDMDARTILHSNGANQRRYMTAGSVWMTIPPGSETFTITPSGSSGTTTYLAIDGRSAFLA